MTRYLTAIALFAMSFFLTACGKEEPKYEMMGLVTGQAEKAKAASNPNVKAKALIAADTGPKAAQKCRASQQFRSGTYDNADMRPVSVPELGIKHIKDFDLEVMASTPEKALEILQVSEELLTWRFSCKAPAA